MKLYLKGARLSFTPTLFEPKIVQSKDGGSSKPKYSVACIIEPTTKAYAGEKNPESVAGLAEKLQWGDPKEQFSKAIIDAATSKWTKDAMAMVQQLKAQNRLPLHDGAEKALTPGFAGNLYMNASSDLRPIVRHKNGAILTAADGVIYPGCYGDVCVDIWAQDNQHGKRVNATLLVVTFSHDGDRLAGGATASEDDYAAVPAAAVQQAVVTGQGAASLF
jgi:hypothetical protein